MPFWIDFLSIFDPNLAPTWPPKSTKIHEKSMPRCLPILTSFFDRFLIDFCSQLRPPEPSKSLFFPKEIPGFFKKSAFEVGIDFWCHFGANLVPTWLPKSFKIYEKSRPRCLRMLTCFFDQFLIDFAPNFDPPNLHVFSKGKRGFWKIAFWR